MLLLDCLSISLYCETTLLLGGGSWVLRIGFLWLRAGTWLSMVYGFGDWFGLVSRFLSSDEMNCCLLMVSDYFGLSPLQN